MSEDFFKTAIVGWLCVFVLVLTVIVLAGSMDFKEQELGRNFAKEQCEKQNMSFVELRWENPDNDDRVVQIVCKSTQVKKLDGGEYTIKTE